MFFSSGALPFWAAAPKGTKSCRTRGIPVRLSVHPSVRPSLPWGFRSPNLASEAHIWPLRPTWANGCTDGCTGIPRVLQDFVPFGDAAQKAEGTSFLRLFSK